MAWIPDVAFVVLLISVFALFWLDAHLIRRPDESLLQLWIAIKTDRRHVWPVLGPALFMMAVLVVPAEGASSLWIMLALPAYGFLLCYWLINRRRPSPRPFSIPGASAHFSDGPSGNVHVISEEPEEAQR